MREREYVRSDVGNQAQADWFCSFRVLSVLTQNGHGRFRITGVRRLRAPSFDLTQKLLFVARPILSVSAPVPDYSKRWPKLRDWADGEKTTPVKSRADGSDSWKIQTGKGAYVMSMVTTKDGTEIYYKDSLILHRRYAQELTGCGTS